MTGTKISVAIATYNEEQNIGSCLDSVHSWVDEIILVDGSSTDQTVKIAQKYKKVKLTVTTNKPIFHINKQMAIDQCQGDWILQLDADEIVPPALQKEICSLLKTKASKHPGSGRMDSPGVNVNGYWLKRKNLFLGHYFKKSGQYPDPVIRLFKRGQGRLPCQSVHEQIKIKGEVGWLKNDLLHHSSPSFSEYLKRSNRYTSLSAQELLDQNFPLNTKGFLISTYRFKRDFFIRYFRCLGFLDGFPGFVFAFFSGLHHLTAYIKYYELKKDKRKIDLAKDWD
jgi:glycosyltransferase involved in cell wall biosynthesis